MGVRLKRMFLFTDDLVLLRSIDVGFTRADSETPARYLARLPFGHRTLAFNVELCLSLSPLILLGLICALPMNIWGLAIPISTTILIAALTLYLAFWDIRRLFAPSEFERRLSRVTDCVERMMTTPERDPQEAVRNCLKRYEDINSEFSPQLLASLVIATLAFGTFMQLAASIIVPLTLFISLFWFLCVRSPLFWLRHIDQKLVERKNP